MNLTEALAAMATGHKVKHVSFMDDEYIYNDQERKQFLTEDGYEIGNTLRNDYKRNPFFQDGWELFESKEKKY